MPRLRCTHKLLKLLGREAIQIAREDDSEESDLDWYVNLFYAEGRKCLIFTNVGTLASFVALNIRKRDIEDLPSFFRGRYRDFLGSLEATAEQIEHELESFQNLSIGKSSNRFVLGCMTDFVRQARHDVDRWGGVESADPFAIDAAMVTCPMGHKNLLIPIDELSKRMPGLQSMADVRGPEDGLPSNALSSYLYRTSALAGSIGYFGVRGFLFAVLTSAEPIQTAGWLEFLLDEDGKGPSFAGRDEADEIFRLLFEEHNRIAEAVMNGAGVLPEDCPFRDNVMFNFYPYSPVSQWSLGFWQGFTWLSDVWKESVPRKQFEAAITAGLTLAFFSDRLSSVRNLKDSGLTSDMFEVAAETMRDHFFESARELARLGRKVGKRTGLGRGDGFPGSGFPGSGILDSGILDSGLPGQRIMGDGAPARSDRVGRNNPCPCGSGKKYKYCHGR